MTSHTITLPLAVLFAVVPALVYRIGRVPVQWRAHLQWGAFAAVLLFLALTWVTTEYGETGALVVGLAANLFIASASALAVRRFTKLERLAEPFSPEKIEAQLHAWWTVRSGKQPNGAAAWTIRFVEAAITKGRPEHALRWLDTVPADDLPPHLRGVAQLYRCAAHLRAGDTVAARSAFERVAPSEHLPLEQHRVALGALLDVLDGDPSAEDRARAALMGELDPRARLAWQLVEIHGAMLRDAHDEARTRLQTVRHEHGREIVASVAAHRGPASALAANVLAAEGPYR